MTGFLAVLISNSTFEGILKTGIFVAKLGTWRVWRKKTMKNSLRQTGSLIINLRILNIIQ